MSLSKTHFYVAIKVNCQLKCGILSTVKDNPIIEMLAITMRTPELMTQPSLFFHIFKHSVAISQESTNSTEASWAAHTSLLSMYVLSFPPNPLTGPLLSYTGFLLRAQRESRLTQAFSAGGWGADMWTWIDECRFDSWLTFIILLLAAGKRTQVKRA